MTVVDAVEDVKASAVVGTLSSAVLVFLVDTVALSAVVVDTELLVLVFVVARLFSTDIVGLAGTAEVVDSELVDCRVEDDASVDDTGVDVAVDGTIDEDVCPASVVVTYAVGELLDVSDVVVVVSSSVVEAIEVENAVTEVDFTSFVSTVFVFERSATVDDRNVLNISVKIPTRAVLRPVPSRTTVLSVWQFGAPGVGTVRLGPVWAAY